MDQQKEFSSGSKYWYQNNKLHRVDGPAIEYSNGDKSWYQNGLRHRIDGPAIDHYDGGKYWFLYNKKYTKEQYLIEVKKYL
jgi:hypothetical protein